MDRAGGQLAGQTGPTAGAAAALGVAGAGTAGSTAVLLTGAAAEQLAAAGWRAPLAEAVPALATAAAGAVTGWLAVVLLLGALAALPQGGGPSGALSALAHRCVPRLGPRVAALLTGAVVAAAGSASAHAATPPGPQSPVEGSAVPVPASSAVPVPWLEPAAEPARTRAEDAGTLPRPDLTLVPDRDHEGGGGARAATVRVAVGDTLWGLAAAHLPPGATDTEVARAWPRWYAANRDVIGPDPDLLLPGQRLRVPPEVAGSAGAHR